MIGGRCLDDIRKGVSPFEGGGLAKTGKASLGQPNPACTWVSASSLDLLLAWVHIWIPLSGHEILSLGCALQECDHPSAPPFRAKL